MRLSLVLLTVTLFALLAGRANAVGRMPGGTLQWLGWGYGPGYHAPIAHAYPPLGRAIRHAPGTHLFRSCHCGRCCCSPYGWGMPAPYGYYAVPSGPIESGSEMMDSVPPAPETLQPLPEPPSPADAQ